MTSIVVIYDYFYLHVRLSWFSPFCFETGEELPSVVSSMLFTVHPVHVEVGVPKRTSRLREVRKNHDSMF